MFTQSNHILHALFKSDKLCFHHAAPFTVQLGTPILNLFTTQIEYP